MVEHMEIEGLRSAGDRVFFEYHCNESPTSAHAEWWYRSHQLVTIVTVVPSDGSDVPSQIDRLEQGTQLIYKVRWDDGFEGEVFEDELLDSEEEYCRPGPPARS